MRTNPYSVAEIHERLANYQPDLVEPTKQTRQAATAIVLAEDERDTHVLFIKRAAANGDPWSGHMAFPGGHKDDVDDDLLAAAIRETQEEIGLTLTRDQFICALSHQRAAPRGRIIDMIVAPYLFVASKISEFELNYEVDEVVWGSFNAMISGHNHEVEKRPMSEGSMAFNGYRLARRHFVWGLTYRTLQALFSAVDPNYVEPKEPVH